MKNVLLNSGDLVVLRVRWNASAGQVGLVVGSDSLEDQSWLVLWTTGDLTSKLTWHLSDALLVINDENFSIVKDRCFLGG